MPMRLFFLSLLLVNILCFAFLWRKKPNPDSVPSAFDAILQRVKERDSATERLYLCMRFPTLLLLVLLFHRH